MKARTIGVGKKEQNGDIEAAHRPLKRRVEQQVLLRGSRDFESVEAYEKWVSLTIVRPANRGRAKRFDDELAVMSPMRATRLPEFVERDVRVTSWSTMRVDRRTYSVPSRLIGEELRVRLYENHLDVRRATHSTRPGAGGIRPLRPARIGSSSSRWSSAERRRRFRGEYAVVWHRLESESASRKLLEQARLMNPVTLPWTILHGGIVWIPLVALAVLVGVFWGGRSRRGASNGRVTPVVGGLVAAALCAATMWLVGAVACSYVDGTVTGDGTSISQEPIPFAAQVSSALPFHRAETLRRLSQRVGDLLPQRPELASTYLALESAGGDPCGALSVLVRSSMFDRAAELALACDDAVYVMVVAEHSYAEGDFAAASEAVARIDAPPEFADALLPTRMHLMAGQAPEAAARARRSAALLGTPTEQRISLRCVADYLDAQSGSDEARRSLRESTQSSAECLLLMADLAEREEREPLLGSLLRPSRGGPAGHVRRGAAGAPPRWGSPADRRTAAVILADTELNDANAAALLSRLPRASVLAVPIEALRLSESIALEHRLLTRLRAQEPTGALRALRGRLAMVFANFELDGGRVAEAVELAELAIGDLTPPARDEPSDDEEDLVQDAAEVLRAELDFAILLRASIALSSGDVAGAERGLSALHNADRSAARRVRNLLELERSADAAAADALFPTIDVMQTRAALQAIEGGDVQDLLDASEHVPVPTRLLAVIARANPAAQETLAEALASAHRGNFSARAARTLPGHLRRGPPAVIYTWHARPLAVSPDSEALLQVSARFREALLRPETGLALGLL